MAEKLQYRKIDGPAQAQILRDLAIGADREAFSQELEAQRQARTLKLLKLEGEDAEYGAAMLQKAGIDAKNSRARAEAIRNQSAVPIDDDAFIDSRYSIVDGWMKAVEIDHLTKMTQLETLGRGAAANDERINLEHDLIVLSTAHALAVEMVAEFEAVIEARQPEEPTPEVVHLASAKE